MPESIEPGLITVESVPPALTVIEGGAQQAEGLLSTNPNSIFLHGPVPASIAKKILEADFDEGNVV